MLHSDEKVDLIIRSSRRLHPLCGDAYWKGELNYWNRSTYEDTLVTQLGEGGLGSGRLLEGQC